MRGEKSSSSKDWSFRNNLDKFDDNPPFRCFQKLSKQLHFVEKTVKSAAE